MKHNEFMQRYQELIDKAARCYREAMRLKDIEGREVEAEQWLMDSDKFQWQALKELERTNYYEEILQTKAQ